MAETITGGAIRNAAGEWIDAEGRPLSKEAQAKAEALHAEQADQKRQAEAQRAAAELASDPATRAALRALGIGQMPVEAEPTPAKSRKAAQES